MCVKVRNQVGNGEYDSARGRFGQQGEISPCSLLLIKNSSFCTVKCTFLDQIDTNDLKERKKKSCGSRTAKCKLLNKKNVYLK